jgi:hypothetical protein
MDKAYFRSYIRRYACSPQEIRTALRISLKSSEDDEIDDLLLQNSIEEDLQNSTTNNSNSDYGDQVFIAKSCPPKEANTFCRNGGTCFAEYLSDNHVIMFCKCSPGFDGRQCQYTFNPKLYESALVVTPEVESASMGSLITVILVGLVIFSGLVYLSKTFCKDNDIRDYMYSESSIDPTTMTPVQMYPFSQRSSPSTSEHIITTRSSTLSTNTVCHQQQRHQQLEERQQNSQITLNYCNHFSYP